MGRATIATPRIGKATALTSANNPVKHATGSPKPAVPAEVTQSPRDVPGPDNSATGGNFRLPPVSVGAGFPQPGGAGAATSGAGAPVPDDGSTPGEY
jgi:hypothetical protein